MFPWESAASGLETCPTWADTGQLEQHISGDIVSAAELYVYYYRSTGDASFLTGDGLAVASSVAKFLVSRVRMDAEGVAHIDHVIPPDEYATGDDSVYTNYMSKTALQFATLAAEAAEPGSADPMWHTVAGELTEPRNQHAPRHHLLHQSSSHSTASNNPPSLRPLRPLWPRSLAPSPLPSPFINSPTHP